MVALIVLVPFWKYSWRSSKGVILGGQGHFLKALSKYVTGKKMREGKDAGVYKKKGGHT